MERSTKQDSDNNSEREKQKEEICDDENSPKINCLSNMDIFSTGDTNAPSQSKAKKNLYETHNVVS